MNRVFEDMNCSLDILALATFYELNMKSNIESFVRSCKRNKLFGKQSKIYRELICFFSALIKAKDGQITERLPIGAIKMIDAIKRTDIASLALIDNIEIRHWLENQVSNVTNV